MALTEKQKYVGYPGKHQIQESYFWILYLLFTVVCKMVC